MLCGSDNRSLVAIIFFILGMGTLLPWSFFITAFDYFNTRLNKTMPSDVTESATENADPYMFNNMCVLLSQIPLLLFTLLNSFLYQHIAERIRIAGSMFFILLLFLLTTMLVKVKMEQDLFFNITMATIWFINMFGAVLQGSLFGLVMKFPPKYSLFFMNGQAMAGVFSALAMLISVIVKTDGESAALGYFITPCVATLITICCYFLLPHLKFSGLYLDNGIRNQETKANMKLEHKEDRNMSLVEMNLNECDYTPDYAVKTVLTEPEAFETVDGGEAHEEKSPVFVVFKKIWVMAACVTCIFAVTLSVFPAITALVKPDLLFTGKMAEIFEPLCCFMVFNVMDWTGRSITSVAQWPGKDSRLFPIFVAARIIFVPALMACNIPSRTYMSSFFKHEFAYIAIMSFFAMTNGYFACLTMSYAPQLVESKDAETVGTLMTFFLALGLSLGGAVSFGLKKLL